MFRQFFRRVVTDPIPTDAVWFHPADAEELLREWLRDYDGVRYATDFMDKANNRSPKGK